MKRFCVGKTLRGEYAINPDRTGALFGPNMNTYNNTEGFLRALESYRRRFLIEVYEGADKKETSELTEVIKGREIKMLEGIVKGDKVLLGSVEMCTN